MSCSKELLVSKVYEIRVVRRAAVHRQHGRAVLECGLRRGVGVGGVSTCAGEVTVGPVRAGKGVVGVVVGRGHFLMGGSLNSYPPT